MNADIMRGWWGNRALVAALVLLMFAPLVVPSFPPLVDLPGHMARYAVELDPGRFRGIYDFHWALIGNLGVDLLILPIGKLFGVELGTKLIVMAIPPLTALGLLWIAHDVHGQIPPTAVFALPLALGHPFLFGFVNFALSMAFALLAFALWLRLTRLGRLRLRAALFVVIGPLIWVTHTFGWGTLGVLCFSAELIRQHDRGGSWPHAFYWAVIHCLCLTPPILLMVLWRSGHVSGQTTDWFNWWAKWDWIKMILRDRWRHWDIASVALLGALPVIAIAWRGLELSRNLAASALFLALVFAALPRIVFGSAYADMRLAPYALAIAIVAIRPRPQASPRVLGVIAAVGLAFFAARLALTSVSLNQSARSQRLAMHALDHVPEGARLVTFAGTRCPGRWALNRNWHLAGMALVRRGAYANDQWDMPGAQLLRAVRYEAGYFRGDPSQVVVPGRCHNKWRSLDWSLATLPRNAFDYVWLVDPPVHDPRWLTGMSLVWGNGHDALYRIDDRRMLVTAG